MRLPVETIGDQVTGVVLPEMVELVSSQPPTYAPAGSSALKKAVPENGSEFLVQLFIKAGQLSRIEVATGKYLERVKETGKQ